MKQSAKTDAAKPPATRPAVMFLRAVSRSTAGVLSVGAGAERASRAEGWTEEFAPGRLGGDPGRLWPPPRRPGRADLRGAWRNLGPESRFVAARSHLSGHIQDNCERTPRRRVTAGRVRTCHESFRSTANALASPDRRRDEFAVSDACFR